MLDTLIDFISELLGKASEKVSDIDVGDADVDDIDPTDGETDTDADGDSGSDGTDSSTDPVINGHSDRLDSITGDKEVDDLLNNGIDTEDAPPSDSDSNSHKRSRFIPFTGARQCRVCNCKCYQGGDGTYDPCVCGHQKWQHYWA